MEAMPCFHFSMTPRGDYGWRVGSVHLAGEPKSLHLVILHTIVEREGRILAYDSDYQYLPDAYRPYAVRIENAQTQRYAPLPPLSAQPQPVSVGIIENDLRQKTLLLISGSEYVYIYGWLAHGWGIDHSCQLALLEAVAKHLDSSVSDRSSRTGASKIHRPKPPAQP